MKHLVPIACRLHELTQHERQVVFGLLNELLIRDNKRMLIRDVFGEAYNRQGGTSDLDKKEKDNE
jgi:hypothetical protein|tara:strand:+ start:440 stop:634 length:195 start_codon:yes stop_codon:yes gene_type:complete